jgi:hypothetical protein
MPGALKERRLEEREGLRVVQLEEPHQEPLEALLHRDLLMRP